ncbi:MAG: SDR family oxidoreductase [Candidatus Lokiarchaeota archaeon]|nr:SDR family oxidoreductase [Candidatus Lokiarchaeota archaeon]
MAPRKDRQVVFITGCSSGFGLLTAKLLKAEGYTVYASMRDAGGKNKDKKAELEAASGGGKLEVIECDVLDSKSVDAAVAKVVASEGRVDVLVNNAGFGLYGPIELAKDEDVARIFETNVLGYMRAIKAVMPHMRKQRSGLVVNVGSMFSVFGSGICGYYTATKFAVRGMSQALLGEGYLFNIKVSVIAPMGFSTDFLHRSLQLTAPIEQSGEYKAAFSGLVGNIDNFGAKSGDPAQVARKVAWILGKKNPPFFVPCGKLARLSSWLVKLLPTITLQKMMAKIYNFKQLLEKVA